jgi:TrmH family RNA methyltransferase
MSISKNELRQVRALSQKKYRDETGLFVVEGEKMVSEALASGFELVSVYRRDDIGEEAMARLSSLSSPSPVLAVVRQPAPRAFRPERGLYLALDGIRDPGNLGTILRVADWFGLDGVVASPDTVELYNPKVVQATMGAIFRVPFHRQDIPAFCRSVTAGGGHVYGTFLDGENLYRKVLDCGADTPSVIVIGNESNGISRETAACVSDRLFIPPYPADDPGSESLNAAVATAVTVAEFRRRVF